MRTSNLMNIEKENDKIKITFQNVKIENINKWDIKS